MLNIYQTWGFSDNPFLTTALKANRTGATLLVGRDDEIDRVIKRLHNPPSAVTIEGENGVGKTSLVNVAVYRCFDGFFKSPETEPLYVPCNTKFQLDPNKSEDQFVDEVLIAVAETLIDRAEHLDSLGYTLPSDSRLMREWIKSPFIESLSGGIGPFSLGRSSEANASMGFERGGFRSILRAWLEKLFPEPNKGGVVCVIDNLEILESSAAAVQILESLRDSLFSFPGIRWVFCGALGIVRSMVASPRLTGYVHKPIEILGIKKEYAKDAFHRRILHYGSTEAYLPLTSDCFTFIYEILNNNLRHAMHFCDQYCLDISDSEDYPDSPGEKESIFFKRIDEECKKILNAAFEQITPRAKKLFSSIIDRGGSLSPGDFELYGFKSAQAMNPYIKALESVSLVVSMKNDKDARRKSIIVTSNGWMASYAHEK
jgi:hypothetical protein